MPNKDDIQLIVKYDNVQSVYSDFLLEGFVELLNDMNDSSIVELTVSNQKDFLHALAEHDSVSPLQVFIGFPHWKSQEASLEEYLQNTQRGNTKTFHCNTFGDEVQVSDVLIESHVGVPVEELYYYLGRLDNMTGKQSIPPSDKNDFLKAYKELVEMVAGYNSYAIQTATNSDITNVDLADLAEFYGFSLWKIFEVSEYNDDEITNIVIAIYNLFDREIDILKKRRINYIKETAKRTRVQVVNGTVVCFVYAESHVNELAHALIDKFNKNGYNKVVVFIGKHTKGDDFFHVRSSNVDAGNLVYQLNGGRGKETTASVFLGDAKESTFQAMISSLTEVL